MSFSYSCSEQMNYDNKINEVIEIDVKRGETLKEKNFAYLNEIYDSCWQYDTPWGNTYNKTQYFEKIKAIKYDKIAYIYLETSHIKKDTAILHLINTIEFRIEKDTINEEFIYKRIYVNKKGEWKFIYQQGLKNEGK